MNEYVQQKIDWLKHCIENDIFIQLEDATFELKDLSTGNQWTSMKETICAFLNTDGGYFVAGTREGETKNKETNSTRKFYKLTGFENSQANEENLVALQNKVFQDDQAKYLDLSDYISVQTVPFQQTHLALVSVLPLPDDLKYIHFKGHYFERKLSMDKMISEDKIKRHQEYKVEKELSKELTIVENAALKDLSLFQLNKLIERINKTSQKEQEQKSLNKAKPFLERRYFIRNEQITLLGMLVCGDDPHYFLENRVEADLYFDTQIEIAKDKKYVTGNVLSLMEEAFLFVWRHIQMGRSAQNGGQALPEYPEKLIREVINNALAHRDYTLNKVVTINVEPELYVEIKNPGSFKERLKITDTTTERPIRRIIPGIAESKNPKLANILKIFERLEGQGRGMAALINATLNNEIDVPYYELRDDQMITLRIPSGKLMDEQIEEWLQSFDRYLKDRLKKDLTEAHQKVLSYFYKSEKLNRRRLYTILYSESNNHFSVIEDLLKGNLLVEHPCSHDTLPVYVLDEVLMQENYADDLISLLGKDYYISLDQRIKYILDILYRNTVYNQKGLIPAEISPFVYRKIFGEKRDFKKYESLSRFVRLSCNTLSEKGILHKNGNQFFLNAQYKPES